MKRAWPLLTAAILITLPLEPTTARAQAPTFKARANLVVLHVNVFDGKSDAVPDLPQSAFQIVEDGRPQPITFFSGTDVPVAVGLVIDNSTSMLTRRNMVLSGGTAFASSSHQDDELFTIVFNEHVRMGLPASIAFTRSAPLLQSALNVYPAGGLTAIYDAVVEGLDHLQLATHQKRVLVVLSDGEDNASQRSKADMFHRASRSDALIYTIWTGDLSSEPGNRGVLKELAERSGGLLYSPRSQDEVVKAFAEIAANIRRGYSIGYVPANPNDDGEYRRVKVNVRMPGRNLSIRARDGYTAAGGAEAP